MYIENIAAMTNVTFEIIGVRMFASPVDITCSQFNFEAMNEGASRTSIFVTTDAQVAASKNMTDCCCPATFMEKSGIILVG